MHNLAVELIGFSFFLFAVEKKSDLPTLASIFLTSKRKKKEKEIPRTTGVPAFPFRPFSQCTRFEHRQSRLFKEENPLVSGLLI